MSPSFAVLPARSGSVIFQELPDGAVLFSMAEEVYYGLNPVGAAVWQLLPPATRTLDELCGELGRRYPDVPAAQLREDVSELLASLAEHRLVTVGAASAAAATLAA